MGKQEFEELKKLLRDINEHLENVDSRLDKIDSRLEKIKGEPKKKHRSIFDLSTSCPTFISPHDDYNISVLLEKTERSHICGLNVPPAELNARISKS